MPTYAQYLQRAMHRVFGSFGKNELAVLALSSKIEMVIRDRLAFDLFTTFPQHFVVREWSESETTQQDRIDLAVLSGEAPCSVVELTAMYTFDALIPKKSLGYQDKVAKDLDKARGVVEKSGGETFAILLSTDIHPRIKSPPWHVVGYDGQVRRAIRKDGNSVRSNACRAVDGWPVMKGALKRQASHGEAYGFRVAVDYWIVGQHATAPPLTKSDIMAIKLADSQIDHGECVDFATFAARVRKKYLVK